MKKISLDGRVTVLIVSSVLLLTLQRYHPHLVLDALEQLSNQVWFQPVYRLLPPILLNELSHISWLSLDLMLFCLFAPLAIIGILWRESPAAYGVQVGNWKLGLLLTLGGIALMAPILWLVARTPAFQAYYSHMKLAWPALAFDNALHLFSWEFFFRGFLLFGLARRYGDDAIFLQAIPFAIAHFGKPELETLSTIFGGAAFGYVALKTNSMLYPFLVHWFVQVFTIALAAGML